MTWTQPICATCFHVRFNRGAVLVENGIEERCCDCGQPTDEGLYFWVDPATVKFPTEDSVVRRG